MPYVATGKIQDFFDTKPVERAARRMATGGRDLLKDRAVQRTPVSKPTPGHSLEQHIADRGYRKPGTMRDRWTAEPVVKYSANDGTPRFGATVHNPDPETPHVEWDTRPHIIRPRLDRLMPNGMSNAANAHNKKPRGLRQDGSARLRIPMAGGGYAFPKEVHHPGTQGKHMMRDALQDVSTEFTTAVGRDELNRWAKEQLEGVL